MISIMREAIGRRRTSMGRKFTPFFSLTPAVLLLLSTVLYMSPALWGEGPMVLGYKTFVMVPYGTEARWLAAAIVLGLLMVAAIRWKPLDLSHMKVIPYERYLLVGVFSLLFLYTLSTPELFQGNKNITLEATNRFHSAFYNICILMIIGYALDRSIGILVPILGVSGLLIAIFIGHRSYTAVTLIGLGFVLFRNRSLLTIKLRWYIAAAAALILLALYKSIYVALKIGDYGYAMAALAPSRIGQSLQLGMEQVLIFRIFDVITAHNVQAACTNLIYFPLFIVPFTDKLVDYQVCSTNSLVQTAYFAHYTGGVASNIWAEFFTVFGVFGFIFVPVVLLLLARVLECMLRRITSPILGAGLVIAVVQLTFYVQRNDFITAFTFAKRGVLLAAGLYLVAWICSYMSSSRSGRPIAQIIRPR